MIPRKRLDIGWSDLLYGMRCCLGAGDPARVRERIERAWSSEGTEGAGLACLSVRSGFDALLAVLAFPPGSEVLMSALTIRDMTRIVEEHGLIPVPVDLDPRTLAVRPNRSPGRSPRKPARSSWRTSSAAGCRWSRSSASPVSTVFC